MTMPQHEDVGGRGSETCERVARLLTLATTDLLQE